MSFRSYSLILIMWSCIHSGNAIAQSPDVAEVQSALKSAITFYYEKVATHGGYVYHYSPDLSVRWGEGLATPDQIWIQPPGTPTVGLAFLDAYQATGDEYYLNAAKDAAYAVAYGQLVSGGWQNCVDFDPGGQRVNLYRNGKGRGKNHSSFDDGQTQSALLFMIKADEATNFKDPKIHESAMVGLQALINAQFPNGGFPQVFTGQVKSLRSRKANYPNYDWRKVGRIKNYWDMYTLNDNVLGYIAKTLIAAHEIYGDERYVQALKKIGDFLIESQMPNPQPGWAQQYNYDMQPIWARKFEPPGVSGDETQEAIDTLLDIVEYTRDAKYLGPITPAMGWIYKSRLPNNQVARYYELRTNRPLYMQRDSKGYTLTYDDSNLPDHYGWKTELRIDELEQKIRRVKNGKPAPKLSDAELAQQVETIINSLDSQGRWITTSQGERLVGQPKIREGMEYISSQRFADYVTTLAKFLQRNEN